MPQSPGMAFIIHRGPAPHNLKIMKEGSKIPRCQNHSIPLSEQLRRIRTSIREAESSLEFDLAVRDLERIIRCLENERGA